MGPRIVFIGFILAFCVALVFATMTTLHHVSANRDSKVRLHGALDRQVPGDDAHLRIGRPAAI
jgi:hypothetical protein